MKIRGLISNVVTAAMTLSAVHLEAHAETRGQKIQRPPQFVLLSFDGSKSIPFWKETRAFAAKHNIGFTYFMSGVYFLSGDDRQMYQAPGHGRGHSDIGFGKDREDINTRVDQVIAARNEGAEMGSHVNGHYDGSKWSYADWTREFEQFRKFIDEAFSINHLRNDREREWDQRIAGQNIRGFRAPLLGVNKDMYKVLKDQGFTYDTSGITGSKYWPFQDVNSLWMFPFRRFVWRAPVKRL